MKIKLFKYHSKVIKDNKVINLFEKDDAITNYSIVFYDENFGMFNRVDYPTEVRARHQFNELKSGTIEVSMELLDEAEVYEKERV